MAYYKRIKELREDNDKTQNEIAKYLGMKQPQYCRYENGLRASHLIYLLHYVNITT